VGLSWSTQRNVGPVTVGFQAAPDKVDACVAAVLAELPKIKDPAYLSDDEMANAAHTIEVDMVREREKSSSYAHTISFWWASAGLDYYRGYVDHVKKATRGDIARYLDGYVLNKPFVFGAMLSPEMVKKGLDQAHFAGLAGIVPNPAGGTPAPPVNAGGTPAPSVTGAKKGGK
jgi:zinc protease